MYSNIVLNEDNSFVWGYTYLSSNSNNNGIHCVTYNSVGNYVITDGSLQFSHQGGGTDLLSIDGSEVKFVDSSTFATGIDTYEQVMITYTYQK